MACALHAGAEKVFAASSHEHARQIKMSLPDALLCGEKNHSKPDDFDFGNSPLEFTPQNVQGRVLIHASSNGTRAVVAMKKAGLGKIYTGSFRQLSVLVEVLQKEIKMPERTRLIFATAGTLDGASYEDLLFAAALVSELQLNHPILSLWKVSNRMRLFDLLCSSRNGRALMRKGLEADIMAASEIDASPVLTTVSESGFVVATEKA